MTHRSGASTSTDAERPTAAKYGFKPTPVQQTVGYVAQHLELLTRLKAPFAYCDAAMARVDDAKLTEEIPAGRNGRTAVRARFVLGYVTGLVDHYASGGRDQAVLRSPRRRASSPAASSAGRRRERCRPGDRSSPAAPR